MQYLFATSTGCDSGLGDSSINGFGIPQNPWILNAETMRSIYYTSNVVGTRIITFISLPNAFLTSNVRVHNDFEVVGNLTVQGVSTTVNSTRINIQHNIIRMNYGASFNRSLQAGIGVNLNYLLTY